MRRSIKRASLSPRGGRSVPAALRLAAETKRAQASGADLVYLIARAEDSPKDMYRKLGFHAELGFDVWLRLPR